MDFVSDALTTGKRFRILTVVNTFTRESPVLRVGSSMNARGVTRALEAAIAKRGKPQAIRVDNGTEFTSNHMDAWAHFRGIRMDFIPPGRPVENGYIESFNGKLRDECLNARWFQTLDEARRIIEDWRRDYNETMPRSSLGEMAPAEYVATLLA